MKKLTLIFIIVFTSVSFLSAQDGQDTLLFRKKIRPVKGFKGIYIGTSYQLVKKMVDDSTKFVGIPLINGKYYLEDNMVIRAEISAYETQQKFAGKSAAGEIGRNTQSKSDAEYRLTLGFEYHFSKENIIDIYTGIGIPLGIEREAIFNTTTYNTFGDYNKHDITRTSFIYGFEPHLGIQAFVGKLPVSVSVEWGLRAIFTANAKYKHKVNQSISGVKSSSTYYTEGIDETGAFVNFTDLNFRKFDIGSDVRVMINIYFK
ncbi:MAG: hypothetical protein N4A72_11575 [Bacteroidales bacterium]|jgi:hypothetical protein|nr:hypothetical protein [Bacteroidales bacterium]